MGAQFCRHLVTVENPHFFPRLVLLAHTDPSGQGSRAANLKVKCMRSLSLHSRHRGNQHSRIRHDNVRVSDCFHGVVGLLHFSVINGSKPICDSLHFFERLVPFASRDENKENEQMTAKRMTDRRTKARQHMVRSMPTTYPSGCANIISIPKIGHATISE